MTTAEHACNRTSLVNGYTGTLSCHSVFIFSRENPRRIYLQLLSILLRPALLYSVARGCGRGNKARLMGLRWAGMIWPWTPASKHSEPLDCCSVEKAVALQAGLDSAQIQDPSPGEVLQEENREVRDSASPRPPVPPVEESSLQDEANPDSSLPPCLKVYSRRRPRATGGTIMQQEAVLPSTLVGQTELNTIHTKLEWTCMTHSSPSRLTLKAQRCLPRQL
jgi:hypothetical protein